MPLTTLEKACVEEVLVVSLHAEDGRVDEVDGGAVLLDDAVADAFDGGLTGVGVSDDASFADVGAAGFELRFDEDDGGALPGLVGRAESCEDRGQDKSGGDEGDIHGKEGWGGGVGGEELAGCEEAGVGALAEGDACVVAKLVGDLAVAGVDSKYGGCAGLEHAVGESAGGGADVDAGKIGEVDVPVGEGMLELEAAAADVLEIGAEETDDGVGGDGGAWFVDTLLVDEDAAGEDESLGALAGGGVALIDEQLVDARLWGLIALRRCGVAHLFGSIGSGLSGEFYEARFGMGCRSW